jgi:hypothetical protein
LPKNPVESFFGLVEAMLQRGDPTPTARVLALLHDLLP